MDVKAAAAEGQEHARAPARPPRHALSATATRAARHCARTRGRASPRRARDLRRRKPGPPRATEVAPQQAGLRTGPAQKETTAANTVSSSHLAPAVFAALLFTLWARRGFAWSGRRCGCLPRAAPASWQLPRTLHVGQHTPASNYLPAREFSATRLGAPHGHLHMRSANAHSRCGEHPPTPAHAQDPRAQARIPQHSAAIVACARCGVRGAGVACANTQPGRAARMATNLCWPTAVLRKRRMPANGTRRQSDPVALASKQLCHRSARGHSPEDGTAHTGTTPRRA